LLELFPLFRRSTLELSHEGTQQKDMTFISPHPKASAGTYVVLTCVLSWSFLWAVHAGLRIPAWAFAATLMWIPAIVSVALRLVLRQGFADAGFRSGPVRYWAWAYLGPLGLGILVYLVAMLFQQAHITPYLKQQSMFGPAPIRLLWWNAEAGTFGLLAQTISRLCHAGDCRGICYALGEEIGWRGYLLPKLIQGRVRFPILISGVVWAVWHIPFVLLTFQHRPVVNAVNYALACLTFGVFISWLRLASGSVLVAAMAHSAYNTFSRTSSTIPSRERINGFGRGKWGSYAAWPLAGWHCGCIEPGGWRGIKARSLAIPTHPIWKTGRTTSASGLRRTSFGVEDGRMQPR